jgi:16S rRNA (adenine1518-N6/adenine1519-N6)-dimethyltransferase
VNDPLPPLRDVIRAHGLSARKGLGQHFLFDLNLTRKIAREGLKAVAKSATPGTIYEVGPGPGGLTRALLAEGAHVIAVERDARCLPALAEIAAAYPGHLYVHEADALELNEAHLFRDRNVALPVPVIANLPYNIGTALLVKWLTVADWPPWWASLTLLFQREVAERICAPPGSDAYGRLSVLAQWRAAPKILFDIAARAFVPPPKVTSAVLRLEPLAKPRFEAELPALEAVTAAAFGQRRKMLRQSLKTLTPDPLALLTAANVADTARAEELSLAQFCALARAYARS